MAAKDPTARRLAATIASNAYRANPDRRSARRREFAVPADVVPRYEAEVDPTHSLAAAERAKRIAAAFRRDQAKRMLDAHNAGLGDDDGAAA